MDIRQETGAAPVRSPPATTAARRGRRSRPGLPVRRSPAPSSGIRRKPAGDDRDRILWTGPKGPDRRNLVVRISYDEGRTFPVERLIAAGPAAYSDLSILKDRSVGVLWERGQTMATSSSPSPG